jgi:glycosyltransferase involved in cell wall biosynthesis
VRLLLCSESYPPSVGGVQEVMRQLSERLVRRGHSVTVATGRHPRRDRVARVNGVDVRSFDVAGNLVRGMSGEVGAYREFVAGAGCDAILVNGAQQWTFDALTPMLRDLKGRRVFIPCGFSRLHDPAYRDYYAAMRGWLRECDGLVFHANRYRDVDFARESGLDHLHFVPNGVDEREFASVDDGKWRAMHGMSPGEKLLLSVGSLIAAKGHAQVIDAFDRAELQSPATLLVNGNDPHGLLRGALRRAVALLRTRKGPITWQARAVNRRHRGRKRVLVVDLPRPELLRALKAADLLVSASVVEYSPLVLFESVAAGTPFLSAPVGNADEIAAWTGGGFIYPADRDALGDARIDTDVLAMAMGECLAPERGLEEVGRTARERLFAQGFTWDRIVSRYEAILSGANR